MVVEQEYCYIRTSRLTIISVRVMLLTYPAQRVTRWHGVAVWKWDVNEEVCGICRLAFDACCPDCTVPGDNCSPGEDLV